jgi:hypothetical protein
MSEILVAFDLGRRRNPAPSQAPEAASLYPARVARQLALAHALQGRIESGEFQDQAEMARALSFTRARISQLLDLLLLAPDIQEQILFLEFLPGRQPLNEVHLRPVVRLALWSDQRRAWRALLFAAGATALPAF